MLPVIRKTLRVGGGRNLERYDRNMKSFLAAGPPGTCPHVNGLPIRTWKIGIWNASPGSVTRMRCVIARRNPTSVATLTKLCLAILLLMLTDSPASSSPPHYAIAIHGGAGSPAESEAATQARHRTLTEALQTGQQMLRDGRGSLDVVESVVRILEDSPHFNAGKGAVFNAAGNHELDATIMDGRDRSAGAVGGVTIVRNPVSLARRVMTDTRHVLLVAAGADQFARRYHDDPMIEIVANDYFSTEYQRRKLQQIQRQQQQRDEDLIGTVGCVARDTAGNLAAATSTGGLTNKKFGRLGDSPIPGAGTFADNATCAVSCTGIGEDFIRHAVAYDLSARMAYRNASLESAVAEILSGKQGPVRGGIIAVSHDGRLVLDYNTAAMARAAADSKGRFEVFAN